MRAGLPTLYRAGTQLLGDDAFREELAALEAPTLLLWGEHDRLVPRAHSDEYECAIGDSPLVVLPGAGHVPMAERPEAFARKALGFLLEETAGVRR